ncbi:hypothetical protein TcasGA2_TC010890 [Tribolium castaneum]|uniref:Uncharacterized protein n=1 Tax=Tribolium castaneum TaxID=7070 RepID=D6W7U3_TRICA|nr:hypothetical protein TcasGA2_TC010890 [Tribolium castaneum]
MRHAPDTDCIVVREANFHERFSHIRVEDTYRNVIKLPTVPDFKYKAGRNHANNRKYCMDTGVMKSRVTIERHCRAGFGHYKHFKHRTNYPATQCPQRLSGLNVTIKSRLLPSQFTSGDILAPLHRSY